MPCVKFDGNLLTIFKVIVRNQKNFWLTFLWTQYMRSQRPLSTPMDAHPQQCTLTRGQYTIRLSRYKTWQIFRHFLAVWSWSWTSKINPKPAFLEDKMYIRFCHPSCSRFYRAAACVSIQSANLTWYFCPSPSVHLFFHHVVVLCLNECTYQIDKPSS